MLKEKVNLFDKKPDLHSKKIKKKMFASAYKKPEKANALGNVESLYDGSNNLHN